MTHEQIHSLALILEEYAEEEQSQVDGDGWQEMVPAGDEPRYFCRARAIHWRNCANVLRLHGAAAETIETLESLAYEWQRLAATL